MKKWLFLTLLLVMLLLCSTALACDKCGEKKDTLSNISMMYITNAPVEIQMVVDILSGNRTTWSTAKEPLQPALAKKSAEAAKGNLGQQTPTTISQKSIQL